MVIKYEKQVLDKPQTQIFAERLSNDYNEIHHENHPQQIVPGDYLFSSYLEVFGIQKKVKQVFSFKNPVFPSQKIIMTESGIFGSDNSELVKVQSLEKELGEEGDVFEIQLGGNLEGVKYFFPQASPQACQVINQYCLMTSDISKTYKEELKYSGIHLSEKSLFKYVQSSIYMETDNYMPLSRDKVNFDIRGKNSKAIIKVGNHLLNHKNKVTGEIKKKILLQN